MSTVQNRAVGLHYASEEGVPRVIAKGDGDVADRILALAREHGVPIQQDPDLVELLSVSEVGDQIPAEVYSTVARLISFLWELNGTGEVKHERA